VELVAITILLSPISSDPIKEKVSIVSGRSENSAWRWLVPDAGWGKIGKIS
jgi:hypothetical protein